MIYDIDFDDFIFYSGYSHEELDDYYAMSESNQKVIFHVNSLAVDNNLTIQQACTLLNVTENEWSLANQDKLPFKQADRIITRANYLMKKYLNRPISNDSPSTFIPFKKTNSANDSINIDEKIIFFDELLNFNQLDFILNLDIDLYWKDRLIDEKQVKQICKIIDIIVLDK